MTTTSPLSPSGWPAGSAMSSSGSTTSVQPLMPSGDTNSRAAPGRPVRALPNAAEADTGQGEALMSFMAATMPARALELLFVPHQRTVQRTVERVLFAAEITANPALERCKPPHLIFTGPCGVGKSHILNVCRYRIENLLGDPRSDRGRPDLRDRIALAQLPEEPYGLDSVADLFAAVMPVLKTWSATGRPQRPPKSWINQFQSLASIEWAPTVDRTVRDYCGDRLLVLMVEHLDEVLRNFEPGEADALAQLLATDHRLVLIATAREWPPQAPVVSNHNPGLGDSALIALGDSGSMFDEIDDQDPTVTLRKIPPVGHRASAEPSTPQRAGSRRAVGFDQIVKEAIAKATEVDIPVFREAADATADTPANWGELFQVHTLPAMTDAETAGLLARVAVLSGDRALAELIATPLGRARVANNAHLLGGNPRVTITVGRMLTASTTAELDPLLVEIMGRLASHHDDRLAPCSLVERKLLEALLALRGPVSLQTLARATQLTPQTASHHLGLLGQRGLVTQSEGRRQESEYIPADPLMVLHAGLRRHNEEPIRLFVDFLKGFYSRAELEFFSANAAAKAPNSFRARHLATALAEVIEDAPANPEWEELYRAYRTAFDRRDYQAALAAAEELLTKRGQPADWGRKGRCLSKLKRRDEALACFERAVELAPDSTVAWYNKAGKLVELGRREQALAAYEQAIKCDPDNAAAWYNRGVTLERLHRWREALRCYEHALWLAPRDPFAWNNRGFVLYRMGRHEGALKSLNQAMQLAPGLVRVWNNRALPLTALGRLDDALISYDTSVELAPEFPDVWAARGHLLIRMGRLDKAADSLARALAINAGHLGALRGRVDLIFAVAVDLIDQGRREQATKHLVQEMSALVAQLAANLPASDAPAGDHVTLIAQAAIEALWYRCALPSAPHVPSLVAATVGFYAGDPDTTGLARLADSLTESLPLLAPLTPTIAVPDGITPAGGASDRQAASAVAIDTTTVAHHGALHVWLTAWVPLAEIYSDLVRPVEILKALVQAATSGQPLADHPAITALQLSPREAALIEPLLRPPPPSLDVPDLPDLGTSDPTNLSTLPDTPAADASELPPSAVFTEVTDDTPDPATSEPVIPGSSNISPGLAQLEVSDPEHSDEFSVNSVLLSADSDLGFQEVSDDEDRPSRPR